MLRLLPLSCVLAGILAAVSGPAHGEEAAATPPRSGTLAFTNLWGSLPGSLGGHGAMFGDADADGLPDLYMPYNNTGVSLPDLFIRNVGGVLVEEGAARGIDDFDGGSHGAAWADLDNDGDYDLVNGTTYNLGGVPAWNNVFENDGTGSFTEVTPVSMQVEKETRAVVAFDMDRDGDLDLFAVTNFRGNNDPPAERNEVYRNDGSFQFTSITSGALYTARVGQGATDTDFDGDGDVDILACNRSGPVRILRNDGGGTFNEVFPPDLGIPTTANLAGDGITTADIDNDDDLDLLFTSDDTGELYRNDGTTFTAVQSFSGTDGYSGAFGDLDNDGDADLVFAGADSCWLNDGTGVFTPGAAVPVAGLSDPRGVALADLDDDGDLDVATGFKNSRSRVFRNEYDAGNWLKVRLVSIFGQAGAFGAKTRIYPAGQAGGTLLGLRESKSNHGYLAQDDPVLHFGLGAHTMVDVVTTFLDGSVVLTPYVDANQTILVQGLFVDDVAVGPGAGGLTLEQSFPNPFVASTTIVWRQESASPMELTVYDALGRRIRTLAAGPRANGTHRVTWDGRDEHGARVAGGVYFYRLRAGGRSEAKTLIRIR